MNGQALFVVALRSVSTFVQNILMTSNPTFQGFFLCSGAYDFSLGNDDDSSDDLRRGMHKSPEPLENYILERL